MENTKFSNDTKVFIKDKYNYIDKIEEFFVIIDQTEFQDKIYRNSINIQNNLEVFKKLLYDNFELSQKDTTILLHCLKFVDMLNLFMNKNILNKVFELIRDINDQIAIIPNYESKDEILKKIKYTEKSVIYYKKKHFKLLFFKDDETIYKEFEELFSNSSEARNFRQLQNCFYIFSQKINEEKRLLIQNKINLIKDKKVKNHNGNTYNNYQNTQNFGYNNYYSSYYGYSYPNYNYNSANRVFNHEEEFVVHDKNRNNDTKIDTVNKFIELPPSIDDSNKTIKSPEPVEEKIYPIKENINYNNGNNYSMPGTNSNNSYYNKKFYNNNYINNYNSYGNNNYNYKNYYNYNNNYVSVNKNTNVFIDKGNLNEKESNNEGENKIKKTSQNEKLIQIVNGHKKEAKANSGKNISSSIFDNKGNNSKDEKIKSSQDDYSNKIENNKENIEVIESNKNGDINENIIRDNNNYNSYNNINNENFYNSNKMYPSFQNNKNKYYTNNYNNRLKNYQYNTNENYNYTNNNYYKYINQNNNENTDLNQNNPNLLNNKNNKQKTFYKNYEMNEQINNTCLKKSCEKTNGNVNDSIFTTSPEFHSKENKPSSFENLNLETKSQSCNQLENNNTFLHLNIDQMFEIDKMNNAIKKEEENNKNEKDDYEDNDPEDFLNQSINSQNFNQMEDNIKEYLKNNPDIANDIKNNTSGDDNEEEDESSSDQEEEIEGKQINNLPKNNKIIFSDDANDIVINNIGKNNTFNDKLNDEDIKKPNEEHNDLINNIINNDKNYETTEKIKINLNSEVFLSKSLRNNSELKNDDTNNNYIFQENNMMSSTPYNQNLSNYHDYFMSNYAHFFFRGRDSSIHREYFALKCLEQQKPFLISNHLNDFENKILVPLYQRINITMYKKKKLYYYTYTKYRNIIYKVLYDDKVLSKVEPYGSYVNNFLIDSGDIDICIVPKCSFIEFNIYLERIKDFVIENVILN